MTPEIKEKWITALRSGEFLQGEEELRSDDHTHYCCLGVLLEVTMPEFFDLDEVDGGPRDEELGPSLLSYYSILSEEQNTLIGMNDGYVTDDRVSHPPRSFLEIADWIEENL